MKIKTFYEDPGHIETKVNSWLENTENIELINIYMTTSVQSIKVLVIVVYNKEY